MEKAVKILLIIIALSSLSLAQETSFPAFTPYSTTESQKTEAEELNARELELQPPTIWLQVDPLADKYPGRSPYNYCMNNPLRYIDPQGMEIGNYYDENGNYIGTDGINDNKNYFVPQANYSTVSEALSSPMVMGSEGQAALIASSNSLLIPAGNVIGEMQTAYASAGPFNEMGGVIVSTKSGDQAVMLAVPGANSDPSVQNSAQVDIYNFANPSALTNVVSELGTFHTHPSGSVTKGNSVYSFNQAPSSVDISNAAARGNMPLNNYVIGDKVYIYNGGGVQATVSRTTFFSFGR